MSIRLWERKLLWENFRKVTDVCAGLWKTSMSFSREMKNVRWGRRCIGNGVSQYRARLYHACMNSYGMMDINFIGLAYTWSNMSNRLSGLIKTRIDHT